MCLRKANALILLTAFFLMDGDGEANALQFQERNLRAPSNPGREEGRGLGPLPPLGDLELEGFLNGGVINLEGNTLWMHPRDSGRSL